MIKIYAFADEASSNIDVQIKAMERNALEGLEIRGVDGVNVSDISVEKAKEVKKKLDDNGLNTWSVGSPMGKIKITDAFEEHIEKFKHTLEIADVLGAKNIRIFSFFIPKEENADDYKNEVIERLGEFLSVAKGSSINLSHENEKGIYGDIPERCLELHKNLPELKGVFDPANFVQCNVDTLKAWNMLKDYVFYMHIKDALYGGAVVPAGYGDGNVKEIVKDFLKNGGRNFTIEPHLKVFKGLEQLEAPGEKSVISEFVYNSSDEAFDVACNAFKNLLNEVKLWK